ncbi:MAG: hypothetical protein ACP5F3_07955, partial [Candidatus Syntrophosphaera sp.]
MRHKPLLFILAAVFIFGLGAREAEFAAGSIAAGEDAARITNYWQGGFSTSWGGGINWSLGHVPLATENVYIDSGLSRYPTISSTGNYSCNSVYMEGGTSLNIQGTLSVTYDLTCYGHLYLNNELADLNIGDDLNFQSGSELTIPYPGADINISDDLLCNTGCDVDPDYGDFKFTGPASNIVPNVNIALYNLYIDSPDCRRDTGSGRLDVKGNFTVYASRSFISSVGVYSIFYGSVWTGSSAVFKFNDGTAVFGG